MLQKNAYLPRRVDFTHDILKNITWNESKPDPNSYSWKLWTDNLSIATLALNSKYVQGIAQGNLNPISFGQYSVQDAAYCFNAQNDYLTLEDRANKKQRVEMESFAKARYDSYVNYVESILKQWHISDATAILPGSAADNYIQLEHKIANSNHALILGIISMIPCSQLWAWLGDKLQKDIKPDNIYDFWIQDNTDSWGGAYRLDNFVNEQIKQYPMNPSEQELAGKIYQACMTCELNFFKSACDESQIEMPNLDNL